VKKTTSKAKKSAAKKFSFIDLLHEELMDKAEVTRQGTVKIKRTDVKTAIESVFTAAATAAAGGEKVKFPIIGKLVRRDVKARKAGKGKNPFTGEEITIKARPESKKPAWSFPKTLKEVFSDKKKW
jgi:nucleoid DNA-binding protein